MNRRGFLKLFSVVPIVVAADPIAAAINDAAAYGTGVLKVEHLPYENTAKESTDTLRQYWLDQIDKVNNPPVYAYPDGSWRHIPYPQEQTDTPYVDWFKEDSDWWTK
jgi:hypothetical protein